jgi:hypothetical protein
MRFKTFIEQDAGSPPPSGMGDDQTPNIHNAVKKYSSDALDMDPDEYQVGEQGNVFTLYRPYKFDKWGFLVRPPIQVEVTPKSGSPGMNDVTFKLSLKKRIHFYLPYGPNDTPIMYKGPIEDKTEIMSDQEVDDMRAQYASSQQQGGMPQGMPQGGMPQ